MLFKTYIRVLRSEWEFLWGNVVSDTSIQCASSDPAKGQSLDFRSVSLRSDIKAVSSRNQFWIQRGSDGCFRWEFSHFIWKRGNSVAQLVASGQPNQFLFPLLLLFLPIKTKLNLTLSINYSSHLSRTIVTHAHRQCQHWFEWLILGWVEAASYVNGRQVHRWRSRRDVQGSTNKEWNVRLCWIHQVLDILSFTSRKLFHLTISGSSSMEPMKRSKTWDVAIK